MFLEKLFKMISLNFYALLAIGVFPLIIGLFLYIELYSVGTLFLAMFALLFIGTINIILSSAFITENIELFKTTKKVILTLHIIAVIALLSGALLDIYNPKEIADSFVIYGNFLIAGIVFGITLYKFNQMKLYIDNIRVA